MRQLLLLTAIACFCSVFCIAKVNDKLSHKIVKQKAPADSKPYSGQSNKKTQIKIYKANNLSAPVGEIIGTTTYDLQTNHSVCRRIAAHPNGSWFYAGWTMGKDFSTGASNRGTGFNLYDNETGTWLPQPDFRIEPSTRAGWPTIGFNQGRQFSITHSGSQGMLFTWREGNGIENNWNEVYVGELVNDYNGVWARAVTDDSNIYTIIGRPFDSEPFGGLNGGLNFIRSLDNGNTWESLGGLEENYSNSIPVNMRADGYAIDAANGIVSVVYGAGLSEIILYKSQDQGENWEKEIIQKSSNPLVENLDPLDNDGNGNFSVEPFFGSNGGNTVIIDSNGKSHVVYSGLMVYNMSTNNFFDNFSYFNDDRACALFYWNEDLENPEIIGKSVMNDADADGKLGSNFLLLENDRQPYYSGFICQPQLGIDADDNLYVSYTAHVDGDYVPEEVSFLSSEYGGDEVLPYTQSFNEDSNLYTDVFMIKSMDGGSNWQGPLNVTKASDSEEVYASIPRNIGDTIMLIYQHDLLPGTFLQEPQVLATINEIAAVKILPEDINDSVAPPDSEPYFTAANLSLEGTQFFLPQGCSLLNDEYFDAFAFGMDYPDGIIKDFQIIGLTDYTTPGFYTEGIFVEDSQGNISDTAYYNIEVLPDTEPPVLDLDLTCSINIPLGGEINLPTPTITDYFIFEGAFDESGCDVSENLEISHNIDIETAGTYTATYTVSDFAGNANSLEITVNVIDGSDTEGPVITVTNLPNQVNINQLYFLNDIEISATDNFDCENLTLNIEGLTEAQNATTVGVYEITITAIDQSDNTTIETYSIEVIDEPLATPNNNCSGAFFVEVSPSGSPFNQSINHLNNTLSIYGTCIGLADSYFEFTVPQNGEVEIFGEVNFSIALYLDCNNEPLFTNCNYDSFKITDLPPGENIILQMITQPNEAAFNFGIQQSATTINNNCEDAILINVAQNYTCTGNFNTINLNENTASDLPSCYNSSLPDAFYKFVVPESGRILLSKESRFYFSIYESCNTAEIFCGSDEWEENYFISNLNPFDTLYLKVVESNSLDNVSFCLIDALQTANNNCENAITLEVANEFECPLNSVNTFLGFNSLQQVPSCSQNLVPEYLEDAYYKFTIPSSGNVKFISDANLIVSLYDACFGNELYCYRTGGNNLILPFFEPGTEMTMQIIAISSINEPINFCLAEVNPPPGNACSTAKLIPVAALNDSCSFKQFIDLTQHSFDKDDCLYNEQNADIYFKFIAPESGRISITSNGASTGVSVYKSCAEDYLYCSSYFDSYSYVDGLTAGDTLILRIFDDNNTNFGTEEFCLFEAPASDNNNCDNATPITVNANDSCVETYVNYNNISQVQQCNSYNTRFKDAFYSFTVPQSGYVEIIGSSRIEKFALYNACNDEPIYCNNNGLFFDGTILPYMDPGTNLIIQMVVYDFVDNINFCLKEFITQENNLCQNAELITVKSERNCTPDKLTDFANTTADPGISDYCTFNQSLFYKFVVPESGQVGINTTKIDGSETALRVSMQATCNSDEYFICESFFRNTDYVAGLTPNDTIILQLAYISSFSNDYQNYFCVYNASPASNNTCSEPKLLNIVDETACSSNRIVDTIKFNNAYSEICNTGYNQFKDVYYSYVSPTSGYAQIVTDTEIEFIGIFSSCDATVIPLCQKESSNNILPYVEPGTPVILQIATLKSVNELDICLTEATLSSNTFCDTPDFLNISEPGNCNEITNIDFKTHNSSIDIDCNNFSGSPEDAFFKFVVPSSGQIKINTSDDFGINVLMDCDGVSLDCIHEQFAINFLSGLPPGDTLILQVYKKSNFILDFCLEELPCLDTPAAENLFLVDISVEDTCEPITGTLINTSNNLDLIPDCTYGTPFNSLYRFVMPESGQVAVSTGSSSVDLALYDYCSKAQKYCLGHIKSDSFIRDFNPGDTVILQIFSSSSIDYQLCIYDKPPSENDLCENAIPLTVASNGFGEEELVTINASNNGTDLNTCFRFWDVDAYFTFIAPATGYVSINLSNSYDMAILQTCSEETVYCSDSESTAVWYFEPGEQYIIRVSDYRLNNFTICLEEVSPGENNTCANSISIPVISNIEQCDSNAVSVNLINNTLDRIAFCDSRALTDAYYSFVAPPSGQVILNSNGYNDYDISVSVYETCESEVIDCFNYQFNENPFRNLIPGETYLLQIASENYRNYSFCLVEAPPSINDKCENALPLIVGSEDECELNEISFNALYNNQDYNAYYCSNSKDAFFSFTAPESGYVRFIADNPVNFIITTQCEEPSRICESNESFFTSPYLTPNQNFILVISGYNLSDVSICAVEVNPSNNNTCDNPTFLNVLPAGVECTGNEILVENKDNFLDKAEECVRYKKADAFYKFVVPPSGQILISTDREANAGFGIFDNCLIDFPYDYIECRSFNYNDNYFATIENDLIRNLPVGDTLVLQLFQDEPGNFNLCVQEVAPPENNTCENAWWIQQEETGTCFYEEIEVDLFTYTETKRASSFPYCNNLELDAFYKLIVPNNSNLKFTSETSFGLALYDNCNSTAFYCNDGSRNHRYFDAMPGDTLVLQISGSRYDIFNICITEAISTNNDICSRATFIEVAETRDCDATRVSQNLENNGLSINPVCGIDAMADAFFKFVVPSNGAINLNLFNGTDWNNEAGIAIYDDCEGITYYCEWRPLQNNFIENLPPGDTLILQFFSRGLPNFEFCLESALPSENDICEQALSLPVIDPLMGCFDNTVTIEPLYNTQNISNNCASTINSTRDAFYSFTAPESGFVKVDANQSAIGYAIYESCSSEPIICNNVFESDFVIDYLNPNQNYILQISNIDSYEFSICLLNVAPSENNLCANAIPIEISPPFSCDNITEIARLNNNSLDLQPPCFEDAIADAYFEIIAPPSGNIRINDYDSFGAAIYDSCNEASIFCRSFVGADLIAGLVPGQKYIVQIFSRNFTSVGFCIEEAPSSNNNTCETAQMVNVNEANICPLYSTYGNISNNTLNKSLQCDYRETNENYADAFYKFVVPDNGQFTININGLGGIALYESCAIEPFYCNLSYNSSEPIFANPQDTILFQLVGDIRFEENFYFCIERYEPKANTTCDKATWVDLSVSQTCPESSITGNFSGAFINESDIECDYWNLAINKILYYKFIAPSSGKLLIYVSGINAYQLYQNCDDNAFFCGRNNFETVTVNPLDTLILSVLGDQFDDDFAFCLEEVPGQINDNCSADLPFLYVNQTHSCDSASFINLNSSNLSGEPQCRDSYFNYDIYYNLVVPSSGGFKFSTFGASLGYDVSLEILNHCDSLPLWCANNFYDQLTGSQFEPGDALILRILSRNRNSFSLCIENAQPSVNNICSEAFFLPVFNEEQCSEENITEVNLQYNSLNYSESCESLPSNAADAFYEFVVPANGKIALNSTRNSYGIYAVILDSCNTSIENLYCNNYFDGDVVSNLPPNDTLILRISSDTNTPPFGVCLTGISNIASNDVCEEATDLPVLTINECFENFTIQPEAFSELDIVPDCAYDIVSDVFFSFTVPEDGFILLAQDSGYYMGNFGVAIYENCNDGSYTPIFCEFSGYDRYFIPDLPPNQTLILQVFSRNLNTFGFDICIANSQPLKNDFCDDTLDELTVYDLNNCGDNATYVNLFAYTFSNKPSCDFSYGTSDSDVFFNFVVPASGSLLFSFGKRIDGFAIFEQCNGEELFCETNLWDVLVRDLTPGETLIMQVSDFPENYEVSICLQEVTVPENNICEQATPITIQQMDGCIDDRFNLIELEYNTLDIEPSCRNNSGADAFFEFIVPENGRINVMTNKNRLYFAIYDACNATELFCGSTYSSGNRTVDGLPPNQSVILQFVENVSSNNSIFCIEAIPNSSNDQCTNPISIDVAPADSTCDDYLVDFNLYISTPQKIPSCFEGDSISADLYYEFEAPENGKAFFNFNYFTGFAIYNNCTDESIVCSPAVRDTIIENLPVNEKLILQIYAEDNSPDRFCIQEVVPTNHNNCENAIELDVFEDNRDSADLTGNSLQYTPSCSSATVDAFYQVTVPPSGSLSILPTNYEDERKIGLAVYDTCGGEELICLEDAYLANIENLTPGLSVVLQFFQIRPNYFNVRVYDGSQFANNTCENAKLVNIVVNDSCNQNTYRFNNPFYNLSSQPPCETNANIGAYYRVVVPESGFISIYSDDNFGYSLSKGCNGAVVYCENSQTNLHFTPDLMPGDTITVQVFAQDNSAGVCFISEEPASNNMCENAKPVTLSYENDCSANPISVNNATNTEDINSPCDFHRADAFYEIKLPADSLSIQFMVYDDNQFGIGGVIYDACDGNSIACFSSINERTVSDLPENIILQITQSDPGNFLMCIDILEPAPENRDCENAIQLCGESITASNEVYGDFITANLPCLIKPTGGYWYSFITNTTLEDVSIDIIQHNCEGSYAIEDNTPYLQAFVSKNTCREIYYFDNIETCTTSFKETNTLQMILEDPQPNTKYLVYVNNGEIYNDRIYCNYTIAAMGGIQTCEIQPCQASIGGKVVGEDDCEVSNIEIIIKNESGETIETLTTDSEGNYSSENEYACGNYTAELNESTLPACFIANMNVKNFIINDNGILDAVEFTSTSCAGDFSLVNNPYQMCQSEVFSGIKIGYGKYNFYADNNGEKGELLSTCDNDGIICSTNDFNFDTSMPGEHIIWVTEEKTDENGEACESEPESLNFEIIQTAEAKLMLNSTNTSSTNPINLMDFVEENKTGYWTGPGIFSFPNLTGELSWIFLGSGLQALSPVTLYYTISNGNCENSYALIVHIEEGKIRNPVLTNPVLSGIDSVTLNETKSRLQIADSWSNEIQKQAGLNKGLLIYPNPSNGIFKIDCLECSTFPYQAFIYNLNGGLIENIQYKLERKSFNETIDIRNELPGVYIVKFYYENDDFEYLKLIKH